MSTNKLAKRMMNREVNESSLSIPDKKKILRQIKRERL